MKKAYFYTNYNNIVVLKTYLDVIKSALTNCGYECAYVKSLEGIDRESLIVHVMGIDAAKYYLKGYTNFILWQQGATADESYMRNHSKIRYWILNKIDAFAMKKARFILFVSDYMRHHYEELAHCSFLDKSYLMPCFNEQLNTQVFKRKNYANKTFCYVGSLDLWQCFRETVGLYKSIESKIPNTKLKVLTFDVEKGKQILNEFSIVNYEIKQVSKEQVKQELIESSYGFIIREDNMVNRVATPTKFSSYMSAGVIPIYSSCLIDFDTESKSKNMKYALGLPQMIDMTKIIEFINNDVETEEIQAEYDNLFSTYYSENYHANNIIEQFRKLPI